jgi:hypothetical protein
MAVHGRRGRHGWADQMGASARTLTTFEVAVAGGGTALARLQAVSVHGQAHGATRLAPLKACGLEDFVQPFTFGLRLDQTRAGHDHGQLYVSGDFLPQLFNDGCCLAHVFNAAVGARANEHFVHIDVVERLAGLQSHVDQGALDGIAPRRVFFLLGVRHTGIDAQNHLW